MRYSYSVWIKTGPQALAGTDSNIALQLNGTEGQSEIITIVPDDVYAFDVNSTDRVTVETDTTLGDLTQVCLGHAGNIDMHWFVESVRVRDNVTQEEWFFVVNAWVQRTADAPRTCTNIITATD